MSRNETQETITQWSEETFGPTHPYQIAKRMAKEVKELLDLFVRIGHKWDGEKQVPIPVDEIDPELIQQLHMECADIEVMLRQVSELLHLELQDGVNFKMSINRGRRWAFDEGKQETRHVSEFTEEGSGLTMRLDRWYVLSDSGSCYYPEGFEDSALALKWIQSSYACTEFGHKPEDAGIPPWDPGERCWGDYGDGGFSINVMYGRDLYDFWKNFL